MATPSREEESAVQSIVTRAAWQLLAPRRFRRRFYSGHVHPPTPPVDLVREQVMGFIPWILQMLKFLLLGSLLLLASGASYAVFYQAIMPPRHATVPLHFDYSRPVETDMILASRSMFRRTKSLPPDTAVVPTAVVDLFAKHVAWEAFHEAVTPPPLTQRRLLHARQAYYIELLLFLPESTHNRNAGLFGVVTDVQSSNATTLARSTRWTQLPHESTWIATSRKFVCLPAFWIGALTEFRTLEVAAFRHFVESRDFPLRYLTIELQRYSSRQPVVEVLSGELRIGKELNVFQELLKEWYYTGFFVGTLSFAMFYILLWSSVLQILQRMGLFRFWYGLEEPVCDLDMDLSLGGLEGNATRDCNIHDGEEMRNDHINGDTPEPHFEDWHGFDAPPNARDRSLPIPDHSATISNHQSREDSEEDWEDIFYPATDGAEN